VGYLALHLVGNALVFAGPRLFNEYSHQLVSNPLIVPIEAGLLIVFLLHIYKAVTNVFANTAARPVRYTRRARAGHTSRKSLASSTMIWSGLLLLVFVAIHVKQFKFGTWYPSAADADVRDLYRTELEVFKRPLWAAFYALCTVVAGLHLRHGIASGVQSLGINHPVYTKRLTVWSLLFAIVIGGGLASIPIIVYLTF
jgi:succinate dehydrogenase / fumarate reductase cytochrome b subunit